MKLIYISQSNRKKRVANSIQSQNMAFALKNKFKKTCNIFCGDEYHNSDREILIRNPPFLRIDHLLFAIKVYLIIQKRKNLQDKKIIIYTRSPIIAFLFLFFKYKKVCLEIHDLKLFSLSGLFLFLIREKRLFLFPITSYLLNDLLRIKFKKNNLYLLPDAHSFLVKDVEEAIDSYKILKTKPKKSKLKIGYFGKVARNKGSYILEELVSRYGNEFDFHIYTRNFELVKNWNCYSSYLDHSEVFKVMLEMDILLYVTDLKNLRFANYTSPIKVYEYLSTLKPIIYTPVADLDIELKNTLSIQFEEINSFSNQINKLVKFKNFKKRIYQSYNQAKKRTWDNRASKVLKIIENY